MLLNAVVLNCFRVLCQLRFYLHSLLAIGSFPRQCTSLDRSNSSSFTCAARWRFFDFAHDALPGNDGAVSHLIRSGLDRSNHKCQWNSAPFLSSISFQILIAEIIRRSRFGVAGGRYQSIVTPCRLGTAGVACTMRASICDQLA
jgi:hypothetical protein